MKSLADRILAIQLKTEVIEVPEWATKIGITEMDAGQRIRFGEDAKKQPALAMVRLLISSAHAGLSVSSSKLWTAALCSSRRNWL